MNTKIQFNKDTINTTAFKRDIDVLKSFLFHDEVVREAVTIHHGGKLDSPQHEFHFALNGVTRLQWTDRQVEKLVLRFAEAMRRPILFSDYLFGPSGISDGKKIKDVPRIYFIVRNK